MFEQRSEISAQDPAALELFGIGANASGETVNETTAMSLSAVYSCIYVLSSSLAQLPLHVLRKTKDQQTGKDKIERASDHPLFHLLHSEPNVWQTSYEWRESKMNHALAWGNGFTEINRRRNGEVTSLDLLMPYEVTEPKKGVNSGQWFYPVFEDGAAKGRAVRPENMLHTKAFTHRKNWGISPIRQHAETIGLGLAAQKYGNQFFGNGGRPSGILINKSGKTEGAAGNLKKAWKEGGIGKGGGRTAVLHGDIAYQAITISPEEAQFLETRKFSRSEVAGIYNVPAHMINDLDKATFSNITQQAIQFVRHTMTPWVVKDEQELNRKLFTEAERKAGYYVKYNLAGLLRGTPLERAQLYHYGITDGWMDRNEARAFEDMDQREGLDQLLISQQAKHPDELFKNEDEETITEGPKDDKQT